MTTEIWLKNSTPMNIGPERCVPKKWTFKCAVCMREVAEETQTKCGHVFCRLCIQEAIAVHGTCPTCNQKAVHADLRRIYLVPDAECDLDPRVRSLIIKEREIAMGKKKPSFF